MARSPSGQPRRGSLGLVVRDLEPSDDDEHDLLVLTAAHVLEGVAPGEIVDVVSQDDPLGIPTHLGTLRRAVPLAPLPHVAVDAAVIKPTVAFEYDNAADGVWPAAVDDLWVRPEDAQVDVYKRGPTTGLTQGSLIPIPADHFVHDVRARYTSGWWTFGRAGLFADRGDSGSAVFDAEHRFIGLCVALDQSPETSDRPRDQIGAYVQGARQIFTALNVELDGDPPEKRRSAS